MGSLTRSSPYLNSDVISKVAKTGVSTSTKPMTVAGAVTKTAYLTVTTIVSAFALAALDLGSMNYGIASVSGIVGLILVIAMVFSPKIAKYIAFPYAFCEGLFLSSLVMSIETHFPGAALNALFGTGALLVSVVLAYKTGMIKVNETFMSVFKVMSIAFVILLVIQVVTMFFFKDLGNSLFSLTSSGLIGIGITLFLIIYGAFSLVMDIAVAEEGEASQADNDFEWYCAVSFLITVIYLYVQMLRLCVQLTSVLNDN